MRRLITFAASFGLLAGVVAFVFLTGHKDIRIITAKAWKLFSGVLKSVREFDFPGFCRKFKTELEVDFEY